MRTASIGLAAAAGAGLIAATIAFDMLIEKTGDFQDIAEKTGDAAVRRHLPQWSSLNNAIDAAAGGCPALIASSRSAMTRWCWHPVKRLAGGPPSPKALRQR